MSLRSSTTPVRRFMVTMLTAVLLTAALTGAAGRSDGEAKNAFLDELQERTFRYFWETANPANGLIPDRHPTPSFSSVAAVGFGLTTYPIGVEHGWITREQARERV